MSRAMGRRRVVRRGGCALIIVAGWAVTVLNVGAADLGTITFTRSVGMGVSGTAGQNTRISNINQTGAQCLGTPGASCPGNGSGAEFANTSDPFETNVDCSAAAADAVCRARFDPGLPKAFEAVDNQFAKTGVPCGPSDPNFDPNTGFPYDCNSQGTIYQIVPKGLLDVNNANQAGCGNETAGGGANTSIGGVTPSNTCTAGTGGDTLQANFRMAPPSTLLVGAPFQVYSSYKSGTRRIHHIEDGFSMTDSGPNSGGEVAQESGASGGGIMRYLFVIDTVTDATGHITDDGTGNIRANGTFMLEMDDRHVQSRCQIPVNFGGGAAGVRADAGLGSFRAGDDLSPTGAGLLIAANGRKDCFDGGGNPCPTGRVLDQASFPTGTWCPSDGFPGP